MTTREYIHQIVQSKAKTADSGAPFKATNATGTADYVHQIVQQRDALKKRVLADVANNRKITVAVPTSQQTDTDDQSDASEKNRALVSDLTENSGSGNTDGGFLSTLAKIFLPNAAQQAENADAAMNMYSTGGRANTKTLGTNASETKALVGSLATEIRKNAAAQQAKNADAAMNLYSVGGSADTGALSDAGSKTRSIIRSAVQAAQANRQEDTTAPEFSVLQRAAQQKTESDQLAAQRTAQAAQDAIDEQGMTDQQLLDRYSSGTKYLSESQITNAKRIVSDFYAKYPNATRAPDTNEEDAQQYANMIRDPDYWKVQAIQGKTSAIGAGGSAALSELDTLTPALTNLVKWTQPDLTEKANKVLSERATAQTAAATQHPAAYVLGKTGADIAKMTIGGQMIGNAVGSTALVKAAQAAAKAGRQATAAQKAALAASKAITGAAQFGTSAAAENLRTTEATPENTLKAGLAGAAGGAAGSAAGALTQAGVLSALEKAGESAKNSISGEVLRQALGGAATAGARELTESAITGKKRSGADLASSMLTAAAMSALTSTIQTVKASSANKQQIEQDILNMAQDQRTILTKAGTNDADKYHALLNLKNYNSYIRDLLDNNRFVGQQDYVDRIREYLDAVDTGADQEIGKLNLGDAIGIGTGSSGNSLMTVTPTGTNGGGTSASSALPEFTTDQTAQIISAGLDADPASDAYRQAAEISQRVIETGTQPDTAALNSLRKSVVQAILNKGTATRAEIGTGSQQAAAAASAPEQISEKTAADTKAELPDGQGAAAAAQTNPVRQTAPVLNRNTLAVQKAQDQTVQGALQSGAMTSDSVEANAGLAGISGRALAYENAPSADYNAKVSDSAMTLNTANTGSTTAAALHETLHTFENANPQLYQQHADAVMNYVKSSPDATRQMKQDAITYIQSPENRASISTNGKIDNAKLQRELIAKADERLIQDPVGLANSAAGGSMTGAQNLLNAVRGLKNAAAIRLTKSENAKLDEAERTLLTLLRNGQSGALSSNVMFSANPNYEREIDQWAKDGRPNNAMITVGSTSGILQGLGARENDVYINGYKIYEIIGGHHDMRLDTIKQIPKILESPALILKSKQVGYGGEETRLVIFGDVLTYKGKPVMCVLDLQPDENGFKILNQQKLVSAYARHAALDNFIKTSQILYINKKKTTSTLFPASLSTLAGTYPSGFIGNISYNGNDVNISGASYDQLEKERDSGDEGNLKFSRKTPADLQVDDNLSLEDFIASAIAQAEGQTTEQPAPTSTPEAPEQEDKTAAQRQPVSMPVAEPKQPVAMPIAAQTEKTAQQQPVSMPIAAANETRGAQAEAEQSQTKAEEMDSRIRMIARGSRSILSGTAGGSADEQTLRSLMAQAADEAEGGTVSLDTRKQIEQTAAELPMTDEASADAVHLYKMVSRYVRSMKILISDPQLRRKLRAAGADRYMRITGSPSGSMNIDKVAQEMEEMYPEADIYNTRRLAGGEGQNGDAISPEDQALCLLDYLQKRPAGTREQTADEKAASVQRADQAVQDLQDTVGTSDAGREKIVHRDEMMEQRLWRSADSRTQQITRAQQASLDEVLNDMQEETPDVLYNRKSGSLHVISGDSGYTISGDGSVNSGIIGDTQDVKYTEPSGEEIQQENLRTLTGRSIRNGETETVARNGDGDYHITLQDENGEQISAVTLHPDGSFEYGLTGDTENDKPVTQRTGGTGTAEIPQKRPTPLPILNQIGKSFNAAQQNSGTRSVTMLDASGNPVAERAKEPRNLNRGIRIRSTDEQATPEEVAADERKATIAHQAFDRHQIEMGVTGDADIEKLLKAEKDAARYQRQFAQDAKNYGADDRDKKWAKMLAAGEIAEDEIPATLDGNVIRDLGSDYKKYLDAHENGITARRKQLTGRLLMKYRTMLADVENIDQSGDDLDMKTIDSFRLNNRTPERVLRKVFGTKLGQALVDDVITPIHYNESSKIQFLNEIYGQMAKLDLSLEDSILTQLVGDNSAVGKNGEHLTIEKIRNGLQADDFPETMDPDQRRYALKYAAKADAKKISKAVEFFRRNYEAIYQIVNETRVGCGLKPIGYQKGYFPHFNEDDPVTKTLKEFGMEGVSGLPTSIAGLTAWYKPNARWVANFQHRQGLRTTYDAMQGAQQYFESVADMIYHAGDIIKLRQLDATLRGQYNSKEDRNTIDSIITKTKMKTDLSDEDRRMMDAIISGEYMTREANKKYATFAQWLTDYTNKLANKQLFGDRSIEGSIGRFTYNVGNKLEAAFTRNSVIGNISSAINNSVALPKIFATTTPNDQARALEGLLNGKYKRSGILQQSEFLQGKKRVNYPVQTTIQNLANKVSNYTFEPVEEAISNFAFASKYEENLRMGQDSSDAVIGADQYAAEMMARRTKGARPLAMIGRDPIKKLFTVFQTEVSNDFYELIDDLPNYLKDNIKNATGETERSAAIKKLIYGVVMYCVSAYALNLIMKKVSGNAPAPDPIGWTLQAIKDYTDPEVKNTATRLKNTAVNLAKNVANEVPYASGILSFAGKGNSRVPLPQYDPAKAYQGIEAVSESDDPAVRDYMVQQMMNGLGWPILQTVLPFGGSQIKKTVQGLTAVAEGGSYKLNKNGQRILQFPIENSNALTWLQAGAFGKYATPEGQNWINSGFDTSTDAYTAQYEAALAAGISGEQFRKYKNDIDGVTADKNKKGNTIPGTKKAKIQKIVEGYKLTAEQKQLLMQMAGY